MHDRRLFENLPCTALVLSAPLADRPAMRAADVFGFGSSARSMIG